MSAPERGTPQYEWWSRGAFDEAHARNDHSKPCLELRKVLEALADRDIDADATDLLLSLTRIYAPDLLRERYRQQ